MSKRIIACSVTWTVPTLLRGIPGNDTPEVLANGLSLMQYAIFVAVGGDLRKSATEDTALARFNLFGRRDLTASQPVGVMSQHAQILYDKISGGNRPQAYWIIETRPGILPTDNY
jgi:hypothetical protein